jgi:hypothetical protein
MIYISFVEIIRDAQITLINEMGERYGMLTAVHAFLGESSSLVSSINSFLL